ncbi:4Fe-4S binding protein [Methanolobus sp. ZRKC3]|uniref:4Fe-4S binding protein n=1 Tax=Methanolobus sp. ZRKC3 TaxID=3125786 RepID=UPI0032449556
MKKIIPFISRSKNRKKVELYRLVFQIVGFAIFVYFGSQSTMYVVLLSVPLALLFGPVYCGWMCPRGLFQDIFARIGRKLLGRWYNTLIPESLHPNLMYFRYVLLAMVLITLVLFELHLLSDNFQLLVLDGLVLVMIVSIFLSLFVERAACKYFCKEGAVGGVCNLVKVKMIKRDSALCNSCGVCDRVCPMGIGVSKKGIVDDHCCVSCFKCVQRCPVDALSIDN